MPPTDTVSRSPASDCDRHQQPDDAAVRIVYQGVRALVSERGTLALADLTAVTRLNADTACTAMNRLARRGPFDVSRRTQAGEPAWHVDRTDR